MEHRIQAQGGNQAYRALPAGLRKFNDAVRLIAQHGDGGVRQPASYHPDHLACPLGSTKICGVKQQGLPLADPCF